MTPRICPCLAACLLALAALDGHAGDRRKMTGKADGAAIYQNYCSVCHGEAGDGRSGARTSLVPPPADFTNPRLAYRFTREYMAAIVREGKPGTAMVGWKTRLDDTQVAAVVDYVRARFVAKATAR